MATVPARQWGFGGTAGSTAAAALPALPAPLPLYIDQWTLIDECPFYVFFTTFTLFGLGGGGGGLPKGLGRNLLMQFSRLSSSKMEISEPNFVDTLTIQNDQISHVKHVLAPLYVFFTLFGCCFRGGGGGGSQGV